MNITEIIKGIDKTIEGLTEIRNAMVFEADAKATPVESKPEKKVDETPVEATPTTMTGKFDVEELKGMKYNEFKKLAASLGVKCTGTRDEIMERILALDVTVDVAEDVEEEEVVEEAPVKESKSDKPAKGKKLGKKEVDEPARDEFDEQAEAIANETPVEDIIEALADVDIKATKKNAVEKLAHALREGLIEMDEEDEDEDTEEEEVEDIEDEIEEDDEDDDEEISADSYFSEYDPNGFNNPEEMTEERKEAIEEKMDEILTEISEGTLKMDEIESYLEDNCTEEEIELVGEDYTDEDVIKLYMEMIKRTIDNEGNEVEPSEPYEVGEHNMCCGHELKYVKKTKNYVCSQCGGEYEAE